MAIWDIHDTPRGFKCHTAISANEILVIQTINRYGHDIEFLLSAQTLRFQII